MRLARPARIFIFLVVLLFGAAGWVHALIPIDLPEVETAILIDAATGQVLYEKDADRQLPPASMAKLMTMLIALEHVESGRVSLEDPVRTSARAAATVGSQIWLAEGDTLALEQMLRAITIQSANDASVAVAEYLAGSVEAFVIAMNQKAEQLGMTNTHYVNPHGLPNGDRPGLTTARDLSILGREIATRFPIVLDWGSRFRDPLGPGTRNPIVLENTNRLILSYQGMDGLKTGHTEEAGWGLVATAERDGRRLISVVMRAATEAGRAAATTRLLDHGFRAFAPRAVAFPDRAAGHVDVSDGSPREVEVRPDRVIRVLMPTIIELPVELRVIPYENLRAPIFTGDEIAELVVEVDGREAARAPLYAARDIQRAGWLTRLWRAIVAFFAGLFGRG